MLTIVTISSVYIGILFAIANWVEKKARSGVNLAANPLVYSLSIAVYCTTWTFYGSVGYAANSGFLFLTIYLGPTLSAILWWSLLRKMVQLKERHQITSIADLISARYGKSQGIAALTTLAIVAGITPYVALQFRAMVSSAAILTGEEGQSAYFAVDSWVGPVFAVLMIGFTIAFGLRRISPTERHPGMMAALSVESLVKLTAFFAAGIFIVLEIFGGFDGVLDAAIEKLPVLPFTGGGSGPELAQWVSHLLLGFSAILFLPRQFHVAVVENTHQKHIRTAMWLFPLYLLAINVFVFPIAMAGLLQGYPVSEADTFVIKLLSGEKWLAILVFIGGFSAGTGMIMIETMAIATMIVNHLLLPVIDALKSLAFLRRYLLYCRWVAAALFILGGFFYERFFAREQPLISIGLISFAAALQLAPAILGGLFWRKANKTGAYLGIIGGFLVWGYTLVLPSLAESPWLISVFIERGPFGLDFLRCGQLFGLTDLDPITHSVFWSLLVNIGLFTFGSIFTSTSTMEREIAEQFVNVGGMPALQKSEAQPARIDAQKKRALVATLLTQYFGAEKAVELTHTCFVNSGLQDKRHISILELADLESEVERTLAAAIGTAAAYTAIRQENIVDETESRDLATQYAVLLADLKVSPSELRTRADYYRERERILSRQANTFRFLSEVSQKLSSSLDYDATADLVSRVALPELSEFSLLYLVEESLPGETPRFRWIVAHTDPATETLLRERIERFSPDPSTLPHVARALETGRIASAAPDLISSWDNRIFDTIEIRSSLTLPLIARNTLLGTLSLFSPLPAPLKYSDEMAVVEELAHRCAIAIDNARLYRNALAAIRAREEFLSIASHELRTPLTPLLNQIQLLKRVLSKKGDIESYPPEKLARLLESADRQTDRMSRLINELLDISRASMGRLQLNFAECDLSEIARETAERFQDLLHAAGCTIQVITPSMPVRGMWDRLRIEEVLSNLITNAIKYAPKTAVEVRVTTADGRAMITVKDQGPGIAPNDQARIFERFERVITPKRVGGFGLGLYISREIAQAHGGSLNLKSEPGKGAEFTLMLPYSKLDSL